MAQEAKTTYSANTIDPDTNGVGGKGVAGDGDGGSTGGASGGASGGGGEAS